MSDSLPSSASGEPLPPGSGVIRLVKTTGLDGRVPRTEFELSSADKASTLKALSVFAASRTKPEQARGLLQNDTYRWFASLNVDDVREIRPDNAVSLLPLDVVWDPLTLVAESGDTIPDTRPGADGHAGITGLARPPQTPRQVFKDICDKLADLANKDIKPLAPF